MEFERTKYTKMVERLLELPHKPNNQGNPEHEKQVEQVLIDCGITYEAQPNGIQNSPDLRITLENGSKLDIECKSSQQPYPTYNGGLPKDGVLYVFSSKGRGTTVYFSEDVVREDTRKWYAKYHDELQLLAEKMDKNRPEDSRGFTYYNRHMYIQQGRGKINYFTHPERWQCEKNVKDRMKELDEKIMVLECA